MCCGPFYVSMCVSICYLFLFTDVFWSFLCEYVCKYLLFISLADVLWSFLCEYELKFGPLQLKVTSHMDHYVISCDISHSQLLFTIIVQPLIQAMLLLTAECIP